MTSFFPQKKWCLSANQSRIEKLQRVFSRLPSLRALQATFPLQSSLVGGQSKNVAFLSMFILGRNVNVEGTIFKKAKHLSKYIACERPRRWLLPDFYTLYRQLNTAKSSKGHLTFYYQRENDVPSLRFKILQLIFN